MVFNFYVVAAIISMIAVLGAYVFEFAAKMKYGIIGDTAVWGQFGDFMGGSLNPILSFISIILLIKSLGIQNQANHDLRLELENNKSTEKLRSFSTLFFNMINAQQKLFSSFRVENTNNTGTVLRGVAAVMHIEDIIDRIRSETELDSTVRLFLEEIDDNDQIFGIVRAFYITVKIVSEKLSDENSFDSNTRLDHLSTLVNFTDFAQLRLIIIAIQFLDYPASKYLRGNTDFNLTLTELGLALDPY